MMVEKDFNIKVVSVFFTVAIFLTFFSFFLYSNMRADFLYERAISETKPAVESARPGYYKNNIFLISQAMRFNKNNADYYARKADILSESLDGALEQGIAAEETEIEDLYKKAIILNPLNYAYHFKLGWFYANRGRMEYAEEELIKAAELYPTNFTIYLYLSKYYMRIRNERKAFSNLLLALTYAPESSWGIFLEAIREDTSGLAHISLDRWAQEIKYTTSPLRGKFDFNKEGFPHCQLRLKIKVYAKKPVGDITLSYNGNTYRYLRWVDSGPEFDIYELNLDSFPATAYLDDFRIETNPPVTAEKIEFIYKF